MKLFHIHSNNEYNDLYYEGSKFKVGDKPNKLRREFLDFDHSYLKETKEENGVTINYHSSLLDLLNIETISKMSDEEKIKLVKRTHEIIHNVNLDIRELILEDVRLRFYNDKPSRNNCMWLTDEESLPFWLNIFKDREVFEVSIDGNIFVSTNTLLPEGHMFREIIYRKAFEYWEPKKEDLLNANDKEYLFEGEVKLLKRIK